MSLKTSMSARPQVCAPWVFAPTQRAPFPAWPVTQASLWHPMDFRVKVQYSGWFTVVTKIYDLHVIIFTVMCSSAVWPTIVRTNHYLLMMTFLTYSVWSGSSLSKWQNLGKFELRPRDLQLVWMCHTDDVCVCVSTDVNECEDVGLCLGGQCTNTIGSYSCACSTGLELVDGTSCRGIYTHTHTVDHLTHKIYH